MVQTLNKEWTRLFSDATSARDRVMAFARLMDTVFVIPGTKLRVGFDAIVDLVPFWGNLVGVAASLYLLVEAWHAKVPGHVYVRMIFNIAIDGIVGAIPFLGAVADMFWRANLRNAKLLLKYL